MFCSEHLEPLMVEPRLTYWIIAKHVLQYLKATIHYGLIYVEYGESMFHRFIGSCRVGYVSDMKGTLGCCFSLGSRLIS
jgi:hypothetical protein